MYKHAAQPLWLVLLNMKPQAFQQLGVSVDRVILVQDYPSMDPLSLHHVNYMVAHLDYQDDSKDCVGLISDPQVLASYINSVEGASIITSRPIHGINSAAVFIADDSIGRNIKNFLENTWNLIRGSYQQQQSSSQDTNQATTLPQMNSALFLPVQNFIRKN